MAALETVVPAWVTEGYGEDVHARRLAVVRYQAPATTARERAAAKAFTPAVPTLPCASCGKFAFAKPTICYWCASEL